MQMVAVTPADSFLEVERRSPVTPIDEAPNARPAPSGSAYEPELPPVIDFEFWQEADLTWSAHSQLLRVSVNADSQPEVIARAAEAVDDFWQVLNSRYATLDAQLRALLDMRNRPVRFSRIE